MEAALDLTRWPALDLAARRHACRARFQLFPPDRSATRLRPTAGAERAARGTVAARPGHVAWSDAPAVQQQILNRLGWLTSRRC